MTKLDAIIKSFEAEALACGVPIEAEMADTFEQLRQGVRDGTITDEEAGAAFQLACGLADAEVPEHLGRASMAKLALRQTGYIIPWERQPSRGDWSRLPLGAGHQRLIAQALRVTLWTDGKHSVISAVEMAQLPGAPDGETGPQWHVSIAVGGKALSKRPKDRDVRRILRDFGMAGTEEDNHHPGGARHFWRPIDPRYRVSCECKATEATVVEPDGYTWTNPKPETGEECRGCEFARRFGKPCPLHGEKCEHP